jgi:hypothetical protein
MAGINLSNKDRLELVHTCRTHEGQSQWKY